jgi:hypothetical protein
VGDRRGSLKAGENGFRGGLRLNGGHGRGFSGAHGGTGFSGQHFTITGGLGVARGYASGSLGSDTAGCVVLRRRSAAGLGLAFASIMFSDAAVYFLFPR